MLYNHKVYPIFLRKYAFWIKDPISIPFLKKILHHFVGTHDFSSFSSIKKEETINPIRTISKIKVKKKGNKILIFIFGKSFLRKMIRMIIGFTLDILKGKKSISDIKKVFLLKNRSKHNGSVAKPNALFLKKIWYNEKVLK